MNQGGRQIERTHATAADNCTACRKFRVDLSPSRRKSKSDSSEEGRDVGRPGGGDNETVRFIAGDFLQESIYEGP